MLEVLLFFFVLVFLTVISAYLNNHTLITLLFFPYYLTASIFQAFRTGGSDWDSYIGFYNSIPPGLSFGETYDLAILNGFVEPFYIYIVHLCRSNNLDYFSVIHLEAILSFIANIFAQYVFKFYYIFSLFAFPYNFSFLMSVRSHNSLLLYVLILTLLYFLKKPNSPASKSIVSIILPCLTHVAAFSFFLGDIAYQFYSTMNFSRIPRIFTKSRLVPFTFLLSILFSIGSYLISKYSSATVVFALPKVIIQIILVAMLIWLLGIRLHNLSFWLVSLSFALVVFIPYAQRFTNSVLSGLVLSIIISKSLNHDRLPNLYAIIWLLAFTGGIKMVSTYDLLRIVYAPCFFCQ